MVWLQTHHVTAHSPWFWAVTLLYAKQDRRRAHLSCETGERIHKGDGEVELQVITIALEALVGQCPGEAPQAEVRHTKAGDLCLAKMHF